MKIKAANFRDFAEITMAINELIMSRPYSKAIAEASIYACLSNAIACYLTMNGLRDDAAFLQKILERMMAVLEAGVDANSN